MIADGWSALSSTRSERLGDKPLHLGAGKRITMIQCNNSRPSAQSAENFRDRHIRAKNPVLKKFLSLPFAKRISPATFSFDQAPIPASGMQPRRLHLLSK
jgi:hypothetical protein